MTMFSRTDRSILGQWWWTVDRPMLAAFLVLIIFGILMVTTASPPVAEHLGLGYYHFLKRHIIMLIPALIMLFGVSFLNPREIWRLGSLLFVGCIFALILVLYTGMEIKGAQRWLHIAGFSLQPSEFMKPALAIVAAWLMAKQKNNPSFRGNTAAAGLYFITIILLLLQPDLGMTVVITSIIATQIFLAGFPFRYLIAFGFAGIGGLIGAYFSLHHVKSRIDRFLDPESGDSFQVDKSIEAFQNGGLLGTGPGQGTVKLSLPDAHADFIFSVVGEELGLFFVLIIIAIFGFIMLRGLSRLSDSQDMFSVLAVGGILTMFGLQALVHMGSAMHLLPAKGMTLPFVSYGGSSVLSMGLSMGVVLALTRRTRKSGISRGGLSLQSHLGKSTA